MSSSRTPKWDWESHIPRMIQLYRDRMSIPDIQKAIQCEGFGPSLSSVYSKFRSLEYPTDPVARTKFLDEAFSCSQGALQGHHGTLNTQSPSNTYRSALYSLLEDGELVRSAKLDSLLFRGMSSQVPRQEIGHSNFNDAIQPKDERFKGVDMASDGSVDPQRLLATASDMDAGIRSPSWTSSNPSMVAQNLGNSTGDAGHPFQAISSTIEPNVAPQFITSPSPGKSEFQLFGMPNQPDFPDAGDSSLDWEKLPDLPYYDTQPLERSLTPMDLDKETSSVDYQLQWCSARKSGPRGLKPLEIPVSFSNNPYPRNSMKKIKSWFAKPSGSSSRSRKTYASSQFTEDTNTSGYATGYTSPSTFGDIPSADLPSLEEFNGLYRVACFTLHEPQGKAHWKDIPTCPYCQYSSIHNLGWSARYLKLSVFSTELRLNGIYDLRALDAAGNTALHYAAAGGAGFQHLKALIDAGVDPCIANTNGETFIHCMRPLHPFTLEPNADCFNGGDLISLLELLHPKLAFDCRDNDGQTILHALALKVSDQGLKEKVSEYFSNCGYFPTVLDRFGNMASDVLPLIYDCHGQVIDQNPVALSRAMEETSKVTREPVTSRTSTLEEWHLEKIRAHIIIAHAHDEPKYVDPNTGDTVIHALSRLGPTDDILSWLEHFIPRDVDLNLHNREGKHPLMSFIRDRLLEERETGATMSKYLDTIVWKNPKDRIKNNINVNMRDREGFTALHVVASRGRPDSARSLIEAGANVNARSNNGSSILQATFDSLCKASLRDDDVLTHLLREVISHLEHAGAVRDPTPLQERGIGRL